MVENPYMTVSLMSFFIGFIAIRPFVVFLLYSREAKVASYEQEYHNHFILLFFIQNEYENDYWVWIGGNKLGRKYCVILYSFVTKMLLTYYKTVTNWK